MGLTVKALEMNLKNGGNKQTNEIEISLKLIEKSIAEIRNVLSNTEPTHIVNS
jgi:hypothetical protein